MTTTGSPGWGRPPLLVVCLCGARKAPAHFDMSCRDATEIEKSHAMMNAHLRRARATVTTLPTKVRVKMRLHHFPRTGRATGTRAESRIFS